MTAEPPPAQPHPSSSPARRPGVITVMTWIVLGLVPVLWVAELVGPEWLHLVLRGLWVVAAVGTVVGGCWSLWRRRRATGAAGAGR